MFLNHFSSGIKDSESQTASNDICKIEQFVNIFYHKNYAPFYV